jgi:hypothetical protein
MALTAAHASLNQGGTHARRAGSHASGAGGVASRTPRTTGCVPARTAGASTGPLRGRTGSPLSINPSTDARSAPLVATEVDSPRKENPRSGRSSEHTCARTRAGHEAAISAFGRAGCLSARTPLSREGLWEPTEDVGALRFSGSSLRRLVRTDAPDGCSRERWRRAA